MASSVDLSTQFNNLAAATTVMETFTKSMQAKDAQVDELIKVIQAKDTQIEALTKSIQVKEAKADLSGMRDQILTNAFILWPWVQLIDGSRVSTAAPPPDFHVVLGGKDDSFQAQVIHGNDEYPSKDQFIEGNHGKSAEEAMTLLLEASMSLMDKFLRGFFVWPEDDNERRTIQGGHWYGPEGRL